MDTDIYIETDGRRYKVLALSLKDTIVEYLKPSKIDGLVAGEMDYTIVKDDWSCDRCKFYKHCHHIGRCTNYIGK